MSPADLQRVKQLFQTAADLPTEERASWLAAQDMSDAVRTQLELQLRALADESMQLAGTTVRAQPLPTEAPEHIDRYRLLSTIGDGGFGTVWRAEQLEPVRRVVAVKVIKADMNTPKVVARFDAERQALAMMDHPHIAKVFDGGVTRGGRPFLAMELVDGMPLTTYCDRHRMPIPARLELFRSACLAVQHAHQKGIIHRDLKPSNVLVTELDGQPVPKVIDFGIAKAVAPELALHGLRTEGQQLLGTPAYMAPEQIDGAADVDTRADVYGLGVVLYELIAGALPTEGSGAHEMGYVEKLRRIQQHDAPRPSTSISRRDGPAAMRAAEARASTPQQLVQRIRGDLDWIVMRAIDKDRDRRYASAAELAADVDRHLHHEPVQACPPGMLYRCRKFVRRNRELTFGIGVTAAILVIAAVVSTRGWIDAARQARIVRAQGLQAAANSVLEADPQLALLLAREAMSTLPGQGALTEAVNALAANHEVWSLEPRVNGFCFAPDGGGVLVQAQQRLELRRLDSTVVRTYDAGADIVAAQFSADGALVFAATADRILVWRLDGDLLCEIAAGDEALQCAALSPDGRHVVAASGCTARLWATADGREVARLEGLQVTIGSVAFSPGSELVLAASGAPWHAPERAPPGEERHSARVWDLQGRIATPELVGHESTISFARFSPDGKKMVTGSRDGSARIWDTKGGSYVVLPHGADVCAAAFHPTEDRLVTGCHDCAVRHWSTSGELLAVHPQAAAVICVACSPDGGRVLAGLADATSRMLDLDGRELAVLRGHWSTVFEAGFSPDGRFCFTRDGYLRGKLWRAEDPEFPVFHGHRNAVTSVAFSPDGRELLTTGSSTDAVAIRWDRRTAEPLMRLEGHDSGLSSGSFSPQMDRVVTASADGTAIVWSIEGEQLAALDGHAGEVRDAAFDPAGQLVATASVDGAARIWNRGSELVRQLETGPANDVSFSADGRWLLVTGERTTLWQADTGQPGGTFRGGSSGCLAPDAAHLVISTGRIAPVFRRDNTRRSLLRGHESGLTSAAFSHDGSRIVTSSRDGTARIWDLDGRELLILRHRRGYPRCAAFSPDDRYVATGSGDGSVRIWPVDPERIRALVAQRTIRDFRPEEHKRFASLLGAR